MSQSPKTDAFIAAQPPVLLTLGPVEAATRIRNLMLAWAEFARGLEISGNAMPVNAELLAALERVTGALEYEVTNGHVSAAGQGRYQGTLEVARGAIAKARSALPPTDDPLEMARRGGYEEF